LVCSKYEWDKLEILDVLKPFFEIIKSEDSNGPITGIALQSVEKFLKFPIVHINTNGAKGILEEIVDTLKHCQFEVSNSSFDEQVLIKICQVFGTCISCDVGSLLDEKKTFEIIKSSFRVGRETRPSETLRNLSDAIMLDMVECIFKRVVEKGDKENDMYKVFEFICDLCDPDKEGKSASVRILGLQLANSVLEIFENTLPTYSNILNLCCNNLSRSLLKVFLLH
jgi:hypothetical protein